MEPEVDNNMKKCMTNALSPKRVSDPAYGKDWLIDWLVTESPGYRPGGIDPTIYAMLWEGIPDLDMLLIIKKYLYLNIYISPTELDIVCL